MLSCCDLHTNWPHGKNLSSFGSFTQNIPHKNPHFYSSNESQRKQKINPFLAFTKALCPNDTHNDIHSKRVRFSCRVCGMFPLSCYMLHAVTFSIAMHGSKNKSSNNLRTKVSAIKDPIFLDFACSYACNALQSSLNFLFFSD